MTQYKQKGNYELTELDGDWIILNTDQFTITKLNEAGGHCWSLLKKPQTIESLSDSIFDLFPSVGNKEQIKEDVEDFINHLTMCGLIQHVH